MSNSEHETLRVTRRGARLDVALHRPEVRNAFDDRTLAELQEVLDEAQADEGVRVLVLTGDGPTFCAGADLGWMKRAAEFSAEQNREDARRMAHLFMTLEAMPMPTVAAIQGAALGGGTGLAACVDVALAAEDARFGFTEVRLGIVPAVISAFVLRKIGRGHALRYFATGEIFDGRRAAEIGLVSEAVPAAELQARCESVVKQVLSVGPKAARRAKLLVDEVAGAPYPDVLDDTAALIAELRATEEAREGMSAFLEKRRPNWQEGDS